jgi:ABC-type amino acid transport substrate-binding protein
MVLCLRPKSSRRHGFVDSLKRLVVRRESPTRSITELAGKQVGFARGSIATYTIARLAPTARQQAFPTHRDGLRALQQGAIDGFVADDVAHAHAGVHSELVMLPERALSTLF